MLYCITDTLLHPISDTLQPSLFRYKLYMSWTPRNTLLRDWRYTMFVDTGWSIPWKYSI